MRLRLVVFSFALLFTLSVWGEDGERTMTLNLNDADIRAFIATVSEMTGKNFIIDPRVKGKVTVVSGTPVPPDRVYEIFLSVLKVHGFAAVPSGDAIKILPDATAGKDRVPTVYDEEPDESDKLVTRVIQVNHADAAQLVPILRPLLPQQAHLAAHTNSNTLVVTDSAANINRVVGIIHRIDQANNRDIEIIPLQYSLASDLQKTLTSLNKATDPKATGQASTMIADDRTNSLILSGEPTWRTNMRLLIAQLDTPIANDDNTEVIYLKYAAAKSLVSVLQGVGTQQLKAQGADANAKGGTGNTARFDIQADETTNALVVTAPPFLMRSLRSVIKKLDIRRAQVLIEAIIAELQYDKSIELGVEWETAIPGTGFSAGTQFPTTLSSINSYPATTGGGLSIGYFANGSLRALIKAFAGNDDANILSTPSLVTLDNEQATIHVGQNVPFVTGQYSNSDSVGGSNPFQTIERHDVGVKLTVTPQINEGNTIRMKIQQEVSSVVPATSDTSGATDVVTNKRIIETTVLVDDQETIVLGGLVHDNLTETVSKVPLLGDIPVLGLLFQNRRTALEKRNLMIFLRPEIMRTRRTGAEVTRNRYNEIRQLQKEAKDGGIPLMPFEDPPVLPAEGANSPYPPPPAPAPEEKSDTLPQEEEQSTLHNDLWFQTVY